jgi:hypothetical protein
VRQSIRCTPSASSIAGPPCPPAEIGTHPTRLQISRTRAHFAPELFGKLLAFLTLSIVFPSVARGCHLIFDCRCIRLHCLRSSVFVSLRCTQSLPRRGCSVNQSEVKRDTVSIQCNFLSLLGSKDVRKARARRRHPKQRAEDNSTRCTFSAPIDGCSSAEAASPNP